MGQATTTGRWVRGRTAAPGQSKDLVKIENTIAQGGRAQGLGPHQSTRVSKNDAVFARVCGQVSAAGGGVRSVLDSLIQVSRSHAPRGNAGRALRVRSWRRTRSARTCSYAGEQERGSVGARVGIRDDLGWTGHLPIGANLNNQLISGRTQERDDGGRERLKAASASASASAWAFRHHLKACRPARWVPAVDFENPGIDLAAGECHQAPRGYPAGLVQTVPIPRALVLNVLFDHQRIEQLADDPDGAQRTVLRGA